MKTLLDKAALLGAAMLYLMAVFAIPILVVTLIAIAGMCS